jgi:hypothetical protein
MPNAPAKRRVVFTDPHKFPVGAEREVLSPVDCELVPAACHTEEDTIVACRGAQAIREEGWIAGAGLDALEIEAPDPIDPILTLDNVVLTPHYASYTEEAYHELRVKTAENAAAVLEGRFPKYLVKLEVKTRARLLQHGTPH